MSDITSADGQQIRKGNGMFIRTKIDHDITSGHGKVDQQTGMDGMEGYLLKSTWMLQRTKDRKPTKLLDSSASAILVRSLLIKKIQLS